MRENAWRSTVKPPTDRSLSDKAYDLFGELLLEQETDKLVDDIENEKANGATDEMDAFFADHDRKNLKQIHSYFHRQHVKKLLTKTLPKAIQAAAIVIACVSIAGGIALATNETVRVEVMKLITTMSDEYTELKLVEDEAASFDVPASWQGTYYPSFIPEGLELTEVSTQAHDHFVFYRDSKSPEAELVYCELGVNSEMNIDTENASIRPIIIQRNSGFYAEKDNRSHVYWSDGRKFFVLSTRNVGKEITIKIAEGVKRCR